MSCPYLGGEGAGAPQVWDEDAAFLPNLASGPVVITGRYAKTSVPAAHRVDMAAELARIRRVLTVLRAEDAILIEIALDEARYQFARSQPNADKIGAAVQRALDLASRDDGFDERREALVAPLRHVCAWLGAPWHRLLGFVGLTF
ncbi:MAG: hypothetical protein JNM75_11525 [Rhodospirillales bacterium]|nr:hypothetical protein [Rhodospirillales bacterium]